MRRIALGVHVHAEPDRLRATLDALRANTTPPFDLALLPDGPDEATRAALSEMRDVPQLGTTEPRGAPACFNRLAASTSADVIVLLESGSLVAPGWLDHLLAALEADPHKGLAGPSTNLAWNEQGAFPRCGGTLAEVARTAQEAAQRFGSSTRTLEPLYSLADFCYAVKREVVQAIGAADEAYGLGPCWEMDYNVRAARAGWRSVWACAAFVYRSPFTARRRREEALRFEASKQLYQKKFCGLWLRGERTDYEPHCRGDACEHFAPAGLMPLHIPLSAQTTPTPSVSSPPVLAVRPVAPLVSCIMPTRDRAEYALQAIRYFERQDYAERELVIVDDGEQNLAGHLPDDAHICYVRLPQRESIGAKRNRACELARGDMIAHWDDDDWYAPDRLSRQVAPLLSKQADITGLVAGVFFDLPRWEFWTCTPDLHRRLFVHDVHGGTLVYQRRVWEHLSRYPDASLAEDAAFLRQAVRRGARLSKLGNHGLFIYLRHAANSWSFACGEFLDPAGWQRVGEPSLPARDRAFYAAHSLATPDFSPPGGPLVSCIMPTANRRVFVPRAVEYFRRQDYAHRELIVLDDGDEPAADLIPPDSRIRYVPLEKKVSLGAKRNLACEAASGDLIMHWDDDDWMASHRIRYQVESLLKGDAQVCGLRQMLFYDPTAKQAWLYDYPANQRTWLAGGSLLFTRELWRRSPFPDIPAGEDTRFIWSHEVKRALALPDCFFYVAMIHPRNTSPKACGGPYWSRWPGDMGGIMGTDLDWYHGARP